MKFKNLINVIKETERFLEKAKELRKQELSRAKTLGELVGKNDRVSDGYRTAEVKRASMDLTKLLTKLRQETG